MKYRLTPLNIFSSLLVGFEILFLAVPESLSQQSNSYLHIYLIPLAIAGYIIDYFLQKKIKAYIWLFSVEILFIALYFLQNFLP